MLKPLPIRYQPKPSTQELSRMINPDHETEQYYSSVDKSIIVKTAIEATEVLKKWWDSPIEYKQSEAGRDQLAEFCALSLAVSRPGEMITVDDVAAFCARLAEFYTNSGLVELIQKGLIFPSLEKDELYFIPLKSLIEQMQENA